MRRKIKFVTSGLSRRTVMIYTNLELIVNHTPFKNRIYTVAHAKYICAITIQYNIQFRCITKCQYIQQKSSPNNPQLQNTRSVFTFALCDAAAKKKKTRRIFMCACVCLCAFAQLKYVLLMIVSFEHTKYLCYAPRIPSIPTMMRVCDSRALIAPLFCAPTTLRNACPAAASDSGAWFCLIFVFMNNPRLVLLRISNRENMHSRCAYADIFCARARNAHLSAA